MANHTDNAGDNPTKQPQIFVQQPDGFLKYSTCLGDTVRMSNMPQASTDYFLTMGASTLLLSLKPSPIVAKFLPSLYLLLAAQDVSVHMT